MSKDKDFQSDQMNKLWLQFEKLYPSEQECLSEIFRRAVEAGVLTCSKCNCRELMLIGGTRFAVCSVCSHRQSLTAGTVLHRGKIIRTWWAALWLLENQIVISSNELAARTGVAQSSAWVILRKLAIYSAEVLVSLSDCRVESAWFYSLFQKRSRLTPANGHPLEEERAFEPPREHSQIETNGIRPTNDDSSANATKAKILELLMEGQCDYDRLLHTVTDSHGELAEAIFELQTERAITCLPGNKFALNKAEPFAASGRIAATSPGLDLIRTIDRLTDAIKFCCRGISRKYLQLYVTLAAIAQRNALSAGSDDFSLFDIINRSQLIKYKALLEYQTDRFVTIPNLYRTS